MAWAHPWPLVTPSRPRSTAHSAIGIAGTDFVAATGTDDTQAFKDALAYLEILGGGTLLCGPKRYMLDLPGITQLYANLSNITIRGVPGQTVLDFSRTNGFYNGGAGSDGIVRPNGFIRTAGTKYGGVTMSIVSGTYSNSSGAVVLIMSGNVPYGASAAIIATITSGTGNFAALSGARTTTNITGSATEPTKLTYNAGVGLGTDITITGGTTESLDTGIMLTNDVVVSDGIVGMVASGSRSGSTITIDIVGSHGLAVGNLVWIAGDPDITGEDILDDDNVIIANSQRASSRPKRAPWVPPCRSRSPARRPRPALPSSIQATSPGRTRCSTSAPIRM